MYWGLMLSGFGSCFDSAIIVKVITTNSHFKLSNMHVAGLSSRAG